MKIVQNGAITSFIWEGGWALDNIEKRKGNNNLEKNICEKNLILEENQGPKRYLILTLQNKQTYNLYIVYCMAQFTIKLIIVYEVPFV